MSEFRWPIRVYVEDTDAGGIVYYANYLKYMERARTEFLRTLGYDKPALFDDYQFVVHEVRVKYGKPATLDDQIVATARLVNVSKVSFEIEQHVRRDDEQLVEGWVKVACIDRHRKRPAAIPRAIYDTLKNHLNS